jgi:universal stress protein A
MKHYQRILVPVDFSEMSDVVVEQAKTTAANYQARLYLLHVVPFISPGIGAFGDGSSLILQEDIEQDLVNAAQTQMQTLCSKWAIPTDAIIVNVGMSTTETILEIADAENINLIVLGHSGNKGLFGLLGSTATAVVKSAKCDVLVVRR